MRWGCDERAGRTAYALCSFRRGVSAFKGGKKIAASVVHWPGNSSLENALSYLFGPIIGLLLLLRGAVCLHASAVSIGDRAIVFVGSEGAGESTSAFRSLICCCKLGDRPSIR